jgi:hypothetical protein
MTAIEDRRKLRQIVGELRCLPCMKAELKIPEPSVDWKAVARMIERREDLRSDITMVVEPGGRLRFVDQENREVRSAPPGKWTDGSISDLDTTISLLDWIERQFSRRAS